MQRLKHIEDALKQELGKKGKKGKKGDGDDGDDGDGRDDGYMSKLDGLLEGLKDNKEMLKKFCDDGDDKGDGDDRDMKDKYDDYDKK